MEKALLDVLNNYFSTRIRLSGRASVIGTPDQEALLSEIPRRVESHLNEFGVRHLYRVKGSIGNGNIARVPWIGIFRKGVTENAENGYYIVLLFSENMSCCYLSLNQGVTAVEQLYTKKFALRKMREAAQQAIKVLDLDPEAEVGPINLYSTGDLGRAYEAAAIVSYKYSSSSLPSEERFFENLGTLLAYYERLFDKYGASLNSLVSVSESEFQLVALEKAAQLEEHSLNNQKISDNGFNTAVVLGTGGYARSPIIAAKAINSAHFCCEIDSGHWSFTSKAKKQRYVEAHHLIPISHQNKFLVSLDIVENVVSLCATCHRMLHFGAEKERKPLLLSLFKGRRQKLLSKEIDIGANDFLRFYSSSVTIED